MASPVSLTNSNNNSQNLPLSITNSEPYDEIPVETNHTTSDTVVQALVTYIPRGHDGSLTEVGHQAPTILPLDHIESEVVKAQIAGVGDRQERSQPQGIQIHPKLYKAAAEGNVELLNEFLQFPAVPGINVECQEETDIVINITTSVPTESGRVRCLSGVTYAGDTALHIAARFGQLEVAKRICQESIFLLTRANTKLETPLHYAAQAGKFLLVSLFIQLTREEGGNISLKRLLRKRNQDGETALYQAVHHEHKSVVEELMCADDNLAGIPGRQNTSPLYLATMLSSLPIVTRLVELLPHNISRGTYAGPDGQTALHAAALRNKGFVEQVMSWKIPGLTKVRDNSGRTPLHYAASAGNLPAVIVLLEKDRTSAYIADSCGSFPVHDAAKLGHLEVVDEFFKKCPDSDDLLDVQGRNFLHLAVKEKRASVVQWVCENINLEKAMNAQDKQGNTPLHLAVKAKDIATFAYLISSKRVCLNWINRDGLTPLDIACAQVKDENPFWENRDYVILQALERIGCSRGINRTNNENNRQDDQEMEQKEGDRIESMAKSISIGSVLVASATFGGAFTVTGAYIKDRELYDTPDLNRALGVFIIMDASAFFHSMAATVLLVLAALPFIDPADRKIYIFVSPNLTMMAAKYLFGAFVSGTYVLLSPIPNKVIQVLYYVGVFGPYFIQPLHGLQWQDLLVARAIVKNIGWKEFIIGRTNNASNKRFRVIVFLWYMNILIYAGTVFVSLENLTNRTFRLIFRSTNTMMAVVTSLFFIPAMMKNIPKKRNY